MEMVNKIAFAALFALVAVSVVMAQDEAPAPSPIGDAASAAGSNAASAAGSATSAVGSAASAMASPATPGPAASSASASLPAFSSIIGFALISFLAQYLY